MSPHSYHPLSDMHIHFSQNLSSHTIPKNGPAPRAEPVISSDLFPNDPPTGTEPPLPSFSPDTQELHTGSDTFTRPAMGSWINYGLGSENNNLPGFITINPPSSHGGSGAWSSAFLPAKYGGTMISGKGSNMNIPFIKIVPTTDNYGELGEKPTHPELLDRIKTTLIRDYPASKRTDLL